MYGMVLWSLKNIGVSGKICVFGQNSDFTFTKIIRKSQGWHKSLEAQVRDADHITWWHICKSKREDTGNIQSIQD